MAVAGTPASQPGASDWPMWGRQPSRNAVSPATGIPYTWDVSTKQNIRWSAPLGTSSYGGPVIAGGKVFVGTNNGGQFRPEIKGDKGCVLCFDAQSGKLLWQATHDKLASGRGNDWPEQGIASTPYVDGDRVYYVSNRCELVCADVNGFRDGKNDGPFTTEKYTGEQDADFVWILDMIGELGVYPFILAACSPVGAGDLVYVCTGNGIDEEHEKPPAPDAPSFIAVDKQTGRVLWKRNDPGRNILRGQWASPAYGVIGGQPQVIFPGGDGWCYAFEPRTGELLWKFDLNPKDTVWESSGTGTKTSIVATPVIHDDKVFLGAGDDPEAAKGPGHLYAIDATKRGDITETGKVWHVGGKEFRRTLSSVAIADGLLYAADLDGYLHCFDERTGERRWRYDMQAGVWGTPIIADGKVLLGNTDGDLVVLRQGAELKELARNDMRNGSFGTAAVAGDVLYIVAQKMLYAIAADTNSPALQGEAGGGSTSAPSSQPSSASATTGSMPSSAPASAPTSAPTRPEWTMFRGNAQNTGIAGGTLPEKLAIRWKREIGDGTSSTAAIAGGVAYVGTDGGKLLALDLKTGEPKWEYKSADAIESSPSVVAGLVVFGDEVGNLHACDAATGVERWSFKAKDRIISSANYAGDRLVFGSYDSHVYCLRIADGQPLWSYGADERVHGTPAIAGEYVLAAACDGNLHVVNLSDGTPVRKVPLGSVSGSAAAVGGTRVYLGCYGNQVIAIDWQAGRMLWQFEDKDHGFPFLSSAAVTDGFVVIGGRDKHVRAFDPGTGRQRWEFATKGRVDSSPVVVGERAFFGSADGNLYVVDLATGKELWRFTAGGAISASPAVGEGCLVIGTEDGVVYCFGQ
jgi:outer membrane protein assembly factor BamB